MLSNTVLHKPGGPAALLIMGRACKFLLEIGPGWAGLCKPVKLQLVSLAYYGAMKI